MIIAGQLVLEDRPGRCRLVPGAIRTADEQIAEVMVGRIPESADAGDNDTIISPGFIDAHLHLPQFSIIGAHGLPLLEWLHRYTFPAEAQWADANVAREMTRRAVQELVSVGTLGVAAFATVHHEATVAAMDVLAQTGMRGVVGQVLMDRNAPPELCRPCSQLIDETAELLERFPPNHRLSAAVTPRFAVSCSPDLLSMSGRLARQSDAIVQSHLAETIEECRQVVADFAAENYVDVYRQSGLLGERSLFAHAIHLGLSEQQILAETSTSVIHCPTANSFLRSGTMNRERLRRLGIEVLLGSDIGAGYERSMVRVARAMIEAAASLGDDFPTASEAWHMITAGNADALRWSDAGRIQVGNAADLIVIRPTIQWQDCGVDPFSRLLFAWDDRWIKRRMLQGKWLDNGSV